jgi:hypothetical protein
MGTMSRVKLLGPALAWGLLVSGCMMPQSSPHIGAAVRAAVARQMANPVAGDREDPATGLDGRAGVNVMEHYEQSFPVQRTPSSTK